MFELFRDLSRGRGHKSLNCSEAVSISRAEFPADLPAVTELFTAYAESLGIDLSYQNFEHELASLPGKYAAQKGGALFLARCPSAEEPSSTTVTSSPSPETIIGCVCLRALGPPTICELKRLYITPASRGLGAGRMLLERAVEEAKALGYKEMMLDTLATMTEAKKMYARYGFEEVEKYYDSPIEGTVFMRLELG
ncbi:acyl-CoA N-acyltransferase [Amniculicola lignicola CBS 123094]|uniref:Acyl-CoA N-acyltransferase n=1 Tax=Amniculicola lignicola CBS 123094 TaxID=1392246 RepID=A0A6A5VWU8_9PLEO|nr:acyl-CoA N-acyltransferase [Amniculicola lignicola CBS 123094]